MLRIDALKTQVEEYLQGIVDHIPLEDYCPETSLDNYRLKTINRLVRAYSLFDSDKKYKYDYYLALRDYLLIFDTSIQLDEFDSAIGSRFGIHKDPLSERLFASFSLPEYANGSFGSLFVGVFFLISGGVLYYNYPEVKNLSTFYYKRWKSIFPMFYITFLFFFIRNVG